MNSWKVERDRMYKRKNIEIKKLQKANIELVEHLKTLCLELDGNITKTKIKPKTYAQKAPVKGPILEGRYIYIYIYNNYIVIARMQNELDNLRKLSAVYEKELDFLDRKVEQSTGYATLIRMEKHVSDSEEEQKRLIQKLKNTVRAHKTQERQLDKANAALKEIGETNPNELRYMRAIKRDTLKTYTLEKKLITMDEQDMKRDKYISELKMKLLRAEKMNTRIDEDEESNPQEEESVIVPIKSTIKPEIIKKERILYEKLTLELSVVIENNRKQIYTLRREAEQLRELVANNQSVSCIYTYIYIYIYI